MKKFKKIIITVLVATMGLYVLTACAVSTSDITEALEKYSALVHYSELENDGAFQKVKAVNDGFKRNEGKNTIEDDLSAAIEENIPSGERVILYEVGGSAEDLAKSINKQIIALEQEKNVEYETFGCHIHNGYISRDNAVVVIISTEKKPE